MWSSAVAGRVLTFRLAGINNQNFIMQDRETGTWWQQVSGEAILGPLKGQHLELLPFDHLTFATWRAEAPRGRVLRPDDRIAREARYAPADWEARMASRPVPASAQADTRLEPRALVIGVAIADAAMAYPVAQVEQSGVVLDDLGGTPIAIVRAADRSTRIFDRRVDGRALSLVVDVEASPLRLIDTETGSVWNFAGAAISGSLSGHALRRVPFLEEYWFDWKAYHPATQIAKR